MNVRYAAGTLVVKGAEFDIFTTDEGEWVADPAGDHDWLHAPTRPALATALAAWLRKVNTTVAVPFLTKQGPVNGDYTVRRATARGIHARTRAVLATYDDTGEAAQVSALGTGTILAGDADPAEWQRLLNEYNRAAQAMHKYQEEHKIELPRAVRDAVRDSLAEQVTGPARRG